MPQEQRKDKSKVVVPKRQEPIMTLMIRYMQQMHPSKRHRQTMLTGGVRG